MNQAEGYAAVRLFSTQEGAPRSIRKFWLVNSKGTAARDQYLEACRNEGEVATRIRDGQKQRAAKGG